MDRARAMRHELQQLGGGLMAEHGSCPACLDRREPVSLASDSLVANCVDAVVQAVKAAGLGAAVDSGMGQATGKELTGAEYAVITLGKLGGSRIRATRERSLSHIESRSSRAPNLAPGCPRSRLPGGQFDAFRAPLNSLPALR